MELGDDTEEIMAYFNKLVNLHPKLTVTFEDVIS